MIYLEDNEHIKRLCKWEITPAETQKATTAQMGTGSVRFNPTPVCLGYVIDKMALGKVVLLVFQHSCSELCPAFPHL
jgi:hypothetical protein